ncbi:hypothetical protein, partial [Klebsiella pneumoniae]|uniref:hypothetical protein n=3 Tax=Klebsiella pneumoniae TaxID=573 RepID=UPI001AEFBA7F
GRNAGFGLAENTYDLFVGKTLLHGDVLMWLMKTLLTSRCINQRGAGQSPLFSMIPLIQTSHGAAIDRKIVVRVPALTVNAKEEVLRNFSRKI